MKTIHPVNLTKAVVDHNNLGLAIEMISIIFPQHALSDADILRKTTGPRETWPIYFKSNYEFIRHYLIISGETPIGNFSFYKNIGGVLDLFSFGLLPEHRGQGLGRNAMRLIQNAAYQFTNDNMLLIQVSKSAPEYSYLMQFYRKCGAIIAPVRSFEFATLILGLRETPQSPKFSGKRYDDHLGSPTGIY